MKSTPSILLLLPSLRISGGVAEALKLSRELKQEGIEVRILCFWKHAHELNVSDFDVTYLTLETPSRKTALAQIPRMAWKFRKIVKEWLKGVQPGAYKGFLLTHFTTFFFAALMPGVKRICFNQDKEWLFMENAFARRLLRSYILYISNRSVVITTARFITSEYRRLGVDVFGEASIWADERWLSTQSTDTRDIDVAMLLRLSPFKRLDLHLALLEKLADKGLKTLVVTPEDRIVPQASAIATWVSLRPTDKELQELYRKTRVFVLLSEVEGFGLPPLEAMGSGVLPLCRDSGGVRNYMHGKFEATLVPMGESLDNICQRAVRLACGDTEVTSVDALAAFSNGLEASRRSRAETVYRLALFLHQ